MKFSIRGQASVNQCRCFCAAYGVVGEMGEGPACKVKSSDPKISKDIDSGSAISGGAINVALHSLRRPTPVGELDLEHEKARANYKYV